MGKRLYFYWHGWWFAYLFRGRRLRFWQRMAGSNFKAVRAGPLEVCLVGR